MTPERVARQRRRRGGKKKVDDEEEEEQEEQEEEEEEETNANQEIEKLVVGIARKVLVLVASKGR